MMALLSQFKKGMIILWSGAIADIPGGFALCNGANGTPDLRNSFIPCAGDTYDPGDTGGYATHAHAVNVAAHGHVILPGTDYLEGDTGGISTSTEETPLTFNTFSAESRPPYYALAYIMKL